MWAQRISDFAHTLLDPARRSKWHLRVAGGPAKPFGPKRYASRSGESPGHRGPFPAAARGFAAYAHVLHALVWGLAGFWGAVVILPILFLFGSGILSW